MQGVVLFITAKNGKQAKVKESESHSVMSDSLQPHGLEFNLVFNLI